MKRSSSVTLSTIVSRLCWSIGVGFPTSGFSGLSRTLEMKLFRLSSVVVSAAMVSVPRSLEFCQCSAR